MVLGPGYILETPNVDTNGFCLPWEDRKAWLKLGHLATLGAGQWCSCRPCLSISVSLSSVTTNEVAAANDGAFYLLCSHCVNNRYP